MAKKMRWDVSDDLKRLEREDPMVMAAALRLEEMRGRIIGQGSYGLSPTELANLYDLNQPVEIDAKPEREILSPPLATAHPQEESPGQR